MAGASGVRERDPILAALAAGPATVRELVAAGAVPSSMACWSRTWELVDSGAVVVGDGSGNAKRYDLPNLPLPGMEG